MAIRLTDRQVLAAATDAVYSNIVSAPGSGKTTVAAERFGYVVFNGRLDGRGVLGVSFNRTAVSELSSRITARWGRSAVLLPNLVTTFDDLHVRVLHHLIEQKLVRWPDDHVTIDVLDEYRGKKGFRFLIATNWKRIAICNKSGLVVSHGIQLEKQEYGIGGVEDHRAVLAEGTASHEDVRWIIRSSLKREGVVDSIKSWLSSSFRHIVVDEIYDADALDLWTTYIAGDAGVGISVVGDPWQALYGWRGATPEKVQELLDELPFKAYEQPESFRFRGEQMPALTTSLRLGEPVTIPRGSSVEIDVALARRWAHLWNVGDNVLPLAFRTVGNAIDGMLNLLLDEVTRRNLGVNAYGKQAATVILGLDPEALAEVQAAALEPVLQAMLTGVAAPDILKRLRNAALELGASKRPSKLPRQGEPIRMLEVEALRRRLGRTDLVPGMTVHQAKGREWPRVGVALSRRDEHLLTTGLHELDDDHCVLYVALTRAQVSCIALGNPGEFLLPEDEADDDN